MYIGNKPSIGNFVKLDAITTSATATYNLTNGGVAYSPQSANHCIVSLNGVIQSPNTSFTISGSTIVFASTLSASDVIDFILVLGDVLNIGTPSDNTVSLAKLTATGTKDATTFLRGDNTFATAGGVNTPAFMVYRSTSQTISNSTATKIQFNSELFDTDNAYDNATNYRFTPQVAGKYFIFATALSGMASSSFDSFEISIYKNGTDVSLYRKRHHSLDSVSTQVIVEMNGTTDYVEAFIYQSSGGNLSLDATTSTQRTRFGGYKLLT